MIDLPALGLGCAPIGNLTAPVSEEEARSVVDAAFVGGRAYFDTAPHYGLGLSEERLGRALAGRDRSSYVLSTKVGRRLRPLGPGEEVDGQGFVDTPARAREWDFTRDGIRATLEASLERLGVDSLDIVFLHDAENHVEEVHRTGFPALAELRAEGLVRAIGFGMNHSDVLGRFVDELDVDVVLCAGRWTLLERTAYDDGFLDTCVRRGTSVVVGGVYNSGLLADPRPGATYDYTAAAPELVARARAIAAVCEESGVPLRAAALHFPFAHPAVVSVVAGTSVAAEARENAALLARPVPAAMWRALVEHGYLGEDLPLPGDGRS